MKKFYPTYLYVKTHKTTGLKYFGKTTGDPYLYQGSGIRWLKHLRLHGNDVNTTIVGFFTDRTECEKVAVQFSVKNKIVESKEWANMIIENGLDGGDTGGKLTRAYSPMTNDTKKKLSESLKGRKAWNKGLKGVTPGNRQPKSKEHKQKLSDANTGKTRTAESIEKTAAKLRGKKRPEMSEKLKGREVSLETRKKLSDANKGKTLSETTKKKIKEARAKQVFTEETKQKLSGKVVVIDKTGNILKISKELYYSQQGIKTDWEWVMHRSIEAKMRRN